MPSFKLILWSLLKIVLLSQSPEMHIYNRLHTNSDDFPVPSIVMLVVTATTFLLVSFYILVFKSCLNWQQVNSSSRLYLYGGQRNEDLLGPYSPTIQSRGLEELIVQNIPTLLYRREGEVSFNRCTICLSEFEEEENLRVLPSCRHSFHLDCIDIWLQSNDNCPLCRSSITGTIGHPFDQIIAPSSSPGDDPLALFGGEEDFEVIGLQSEDEPEEEREQPKGDPLKVDVSPNGDQSSIRPIRRSFSMDSASNRRLHLTVQDMIRQKDTSQITSSGECSSSRAL